MNTSKFHLYSQGIVAKDRDESSPIIQITPIEITPYYDGDISHTEGIVKHTGVDAAGNTYSTTVKSNNTIEATWFNKSGSNRETPPDVVLGERVFIYQYADEDGFYWHSNGQDDGLRQVETVKWSWANKKDRTKKVNNATNSYQMKVSTRDKLINIVTNKSDNEPHAWTIALDTKNSTFTITDDIGTTVMMDSIKKHVRLQNSDGSYAEIVGKVMNLHADTSINVTTKEFNVTAQTGNFKITNTLIDGSKLNVKSNTQFDGSGVKHGSKNIGKTHFHKVIGSKTDVPEA